MKITRRMRRKVIDLMVLCNGDNIFKGYDVTPENKTKWNNWVCCYQRQVAKADLAGKPKPEPKTCQRLL